MWYCEFSARSCDDMVRHSHHTCTKGVFLWHIGIVPKVFVVCPPWTPSNVECRSNACAPTWQALAAHAHGVNPGVRAYSGDCRCASHAPAACSAYPPWLAASALLGPGYTEQLGPGCTLDPTAFPPCVSVWSSHVRVPPHNASGSLVTSGEWVAVALMNMGENATVGTCRLGTLPGIQPGTVYAVVDVWNGTAYGNVSGSSTLDIPLRPHASVFLKAAPLL
eukprot:m.253900 g.253900  ORF g.253900 m.253900 type:complete len:221 (-) comp19598_c0_seq1:312-974(-)